MVLRNHLSKRDNRGDFKFMHLQLDIKYDREFYFHKSKVMKTQENNGLSLIVRWIEAVTKYRLNGM